MTAMKDAFLRAGLRQRDYVLQAAIMKFVKDSGTIEEAHANVDRVAAKLPKEVHMTAFGTPVTAALVPFRSARKRLHSRDKAAVTPSEHAANLIVARTVSLTIFDTLKIDGKPIGDYTVAEARQAGKSKSREAAILLAATRVVANASPHARIRDVVKLAEIQKIVQSAAEKSDAA